MTCPVICVAGASGSVGRLVVDELTRSGAGPLRLGGRRRGPLEEVAATVPEAEVVPFDLDDPAGTARFCAGSALVVSCAGPSYLVLDRLARAARDAGAAYVDVSGDEPVHQRLTEQGVPMTAVLSAGMLPGLSALVPRWMARTMDRPDSLSTYVGGLERCSPSSAADMILSMETDETSQHGQPSAGWRAGRAVPRLLRPRTQVEVPFVPDRVTAQPFLSAESERLASDLRLASLDFWNVFAGQHLVDALARVRGRDVSGRALDRVVDELTQAAELDLAGRQPYYALVFCMEGQAGGRAVSRTTALRTSDAYRLVAAVAAVTVRAVLDGRVPRTVGFAAEVLDPDWAVAQVRRSPAVDACETVEREHGTGSMDEGTI